MAGFFGADFVQSQPSDSDLVKRGASVMRDIKTRIKTFLNVCFNLETGQLKDDVVPYTALRDLVPSPEGTWNEVDVNEKGLVTGGREVSTVAAAKPYRWVYNYTQGLDSDGDAITRSLDTDDDGLNVATYSFVVPEGVTRIHVRCWGAGGGGGYNATPLTAGGGGGGGYADTFIEVSEGDTFLVWVGEGGGGMPAAGGAGENGAMTRFWFANLKYTQAVGGLAGTATEPGAGSEGETTVAQDGWGPAFEFDGAWGTLTDGGDGAGGATGNHGRGGDPGDSGSDGQQGSGGLVVVEYWAE